MKKFFSITLIIVLAVNLFHSCKEDKGNPPTLPPLETMTIDFSNFTTQKKSGDSETFVKGTNTSNWEFAAIVAGVWKLIIGTTLAVPVQSFKIAIDQTPVLLETKTWQWSFTATVATVTYKARLTGQIRTSDVLWKMYVSKEGTGAFAEFVWFEGTSNLDGTGGQWILNESSSSPEPFLQIDWTKTGASVGTVKYSFVKDLDSFKTSYIEYGLTSNPLNAYYTIHYYNGVKFSDVNVEWNTTTKNGRVKCLDYLGDTDWHCWDSNKLNVTCPL
jgi:hypothetical protein